MASGTNIEWTASDDGTRGATWNPVVGCTRASDGCNNCYAVTMTHRLQAMGQTRYAGLTVLNPKGDRHFNGVVRTVPEVLEVPLHWREPRRVFVNSMSDLFHKDVPVDFIDRVFAVMALTPRHTYQILTKRPERMREYVAGAEDRVLNIADEKCAELPRRVFDEWTAEWPIPNVHLGTSVENQEAADARIPHLLKCPAAVRFLSVEPMLGPVDVIAPVMMATRGEFPSPLMRELIQWVIVGGESGPGARACNVEWVRRVAKDCRATRVSLFVKQLGARPFDGACPGEPFNGSCGHTKGAADGLHYLRLTDSKGGDPAEWPADLRVRAMPTGSEAPHVGN